MDHFGATIIALTDPNPEVNNLELDYFGMKVINGTLSIVAPPMMNEIGICSVMAQVRSITNRGTNLSSMDKEMDIKIIAMNFMDTLIGDLLFNGRRYRAFSSDRNSLSTMACDRTRIATMAFNVAYPCLLRANELGQSDKKMIGKTTSENVIKVEGQQPKGLKGILPWSK